MLRITFNIELSSKPDRTGRSSVMVRLYLKGHKPARVLTSVKVENAVRHWSQKKDWGRWVIKHPNKESLNAEIADEYFRIKQQVEDWQKEEPTVLQTPMLVAERFRAGVSDFYFDWMDKVLIDAQEQAYGTYASKKSAARMFEKFAGEQLQLQSVSPSLVRQFQDHLRRMPSERNNRKRKGSTINGIMARLNIMHQEVLIKTGVSPKRARLVSPWTDVVDVEQVKAKKAKLNESTINRIAAININSKRGLINHEVSFKIWLLSYSLAGARFSDMIKLRYSEFELDQEGKPVHLRYEMMKTGNRISVPVMEDCWQILKGWWRQDAKPTDYVLPFLKNSASYSKLITHEQYREAPFLVKKVYNNKFNYINKSVNQCLKDIEVQAGLTEPLRFHTSRHSFADLARRIMETDNSINMYDIQKMMGHSDLKTTEVYTKDLHERDTTKAMGAIFNRKKG